MKKTFFAGLSLLIALALLLAACDPATETNTDEPAVETPSAEPTAPPAQRDTLIVGVGSVSGAFNPFSGDEGADREVWDLVAPAVYGYDGEGGFVSGLCEYSEPVVERDAEGVALSTTYTFRLRPDLVFSDGTPVTSADLEFYLYVVCDPGYYGGDGLRDAVAIRGLSEYRYDDPDYAAHLADVRAEAEAAVTDAQVETYIRTLCEGAIGDGTDEDRVAMVAAMVRFDNADGLAGEALYQAVLEAYIAREMGKADAYRAEMVASVYAELVDIYVFENMADGARVPAIEGIAVADEQTLTVTVEGIDPAAEAYFAAMPVVPKHYYGVGEDGSAFAKGEAAMVREKDGMPMGAGPYRFTSFGSNVAMLEANELYYQGAPPIANLRFHVVAEEMKLEALLADFVDLVDPAATLAARDQAVAAGMEAELFNTMRYGYLGISAERVPDVNIRRGLMSLMDRAPAVRSYFGDTTDVLERPLSRASWGHLAGAQPVYAYDREAALAYFRAAGYEQIEENGTTVLARDGEQLHIEVGFAGRGEMDHPAAPLFAQMRADLEEMGAALTIVDCEEAVFADRLAAGAWDMWADEMVNAVDPDMFDVYHSEGAENLFQIALPELDALIEQGRGTLDRAERKRIYAEALDVVMDAAVEMPFYQGRGMWAYAPERVDAEAMPRGMGALRDWRDEAHLLRMK